jgi:hypothetical protein
MNGHDVQATGSLLMHLLLLELNYDERLTGRLREEPLGRDKCQPESAKRVVVRTCQLYNKTTHQQQTLFASILNVDFCACLSIFHLEVEVRLRISVELINNQTTPLWPKLDAQLSLSRR